MVFNICSIVGYSVQISNAVGAKDPDRVRQVIRQAFLAAVVCGALACGLYEALGGAVGEKALPKGGGIPVLTEGGDSGRDPRTGTLLFFFAPALASLFNSDAQVVAEGQRQGPPRRQGRWP